MAADTLPALLDTLNTSLGAALSSLPEPPVLANSTDGISLFDTKNELFLAYLHNLVFLILFKIRQLKQGLADPSDGSLAGSQWAEAVRNLASLRLYSEKGIRPLESRLRYELERVIQAAEDAAQIGTEAKSKKGKGQKVRSGIADRANQSSAESSSESAEVEEEKLDPLLNGQNGSARPNFLNLKTPTSASGEFKDNSGIYRPPRIAPVAPPTADRESRKLRPAKSHTLNEYLEEEFSEAPRNMPSIGSNIVRSGMRTQTERERREDDERRTYEETNYVRLPAVAKKEARRKEREAIGLGLGGEEWRDLGAGAERLIRGLDERSKRTSGLEKSRKRPREEHAETTGGGRSEFERRRKRLAARSRR